MTKRRRDRNKNREQRRTTAQNRARERSLMSLTELAAKDRATALKHGNAAVRAKVDA